jgi:hypothetical protein
MIKDPILPLQDSDQEGYSKQFLAAIDKGLSVKPEERPRSIDEFRRMLKLELSVPVPTPGPAVAVPASSAPAASPEQQRPDRPSSSPSHPKRPSKAIPALGIAAILAGVAIAGYASFRQKAPPEVIAVTHVKSSSVPVGLARPAESEESAAVLATADSTNGKPREGGPTSTVRLNVKPWGTVFVDGASQGASPPLKKLELSEGKHVIRFENPSFRSHTIEIDLTKKKTGTIEHDFSQAKQ